MFARAGFASGFLSFSLGVVTLAAVAALLLRDAFPGPFPVGSHEALGAFSLAMIALAYLVYQLERRAAPAEMVKAILLAVAFLFWAANQFWPNLPQAGLFNDIAIGLFVLDLFLVIAGWPAASTDSIFTEIVASKSGKCHDGCCCGRDSRAPDQGSTRDKISQM